MAEALAKPYTQSAVRLKAQPTPGQLWRHPAHVPVTRLSDALFAGTLPALVWRRRATRSAPHFPTILARAPAKKFHHHQPRPIDPHPFELHHLASLVDPRVGRGLQRGTTRGFHRGNRLTEKRVMSIHA